MGRKERISIVLHVVESLYSLGILAWFFLPLFITFEGLFSAPDMPLQLFGGPAEKLVPLIVSGFLVFLIPLICLFKLSASFLERRIPALTSPLRLVPILLNIICSGIVLGIIAAHIVVNARSTGYFMASSPILYGVLFASLAYNAYFLYFLVTSISTRNPTYQEYLEFRRSAEQKPRGLFRVLLRQGIQKRLILSFVPLILVIIVVLSFVLMQNFSNTIMGFVIQDGKNLADRTASVIKANPSDMIGADDYLSIEAKKNLVSSLRFKTMSFFQREPRGEVFTVAASTDRVLVGTKLERPTAPFSETIMRYEPSHDVYEFLAPVTLATKFLGFVMVDYARDDIYEQFFRTQVKVFAIAAIFVYLAVFLIYVSGRSIVFPILFLRMSVNSISNVLAGMVKGKLKISSELLQYRDRVATRDEIKSLSTEIGNMTTVIRGIVPYISASTLKHSERETPSTEKRDLTFLFTDIRGFTTLCEGMKPDKVVEMLNHFLDIQSSVIFANSGDVDKFVGDEVMAMYEGARKELNACKTSLEIRKSMAEEREIARLAKRNVVSIGIGINTGPVVFGSVGAKNRMDFTSIGDTVNLAARLEGANKTYGTKTLITEAVFDKVKESYLCREIDMLTVKGKTKPVRIFELLQSKKLASEKLHNIKKIFEEGLELYRNQKWQAAEKAFVFLHEKFKDETSEIFLRRIALFKTNPPGRNWDGVFALAVK